MTDTGCRYDHAVQAIEALQEYMYACSETSNTSKILVEAHVAIHKLEEIETQIDSVERKRGESVLLSSMLQELRTKASLPTPKIVEVKTFLKKNRQVLKDIRRFSEELGQLTDVLRISAKVKQRLLRLAKSPRELDDNTEGVDE